MIINQIKVIAFDYGGVIKINDSDLIADICEYLGISKEEWRREYFKVNHLANTQKLDYKNHNLEFLKYYLPN